MSKGLSFPDGPINSWLTCLNTPVRVPRSSCASCENILSGACTVALQWTIRIIAIGVCPASHSHHTSNVALAKQPHTQHLTVGMGPVGRGDIDWKHARPLVAAVATGGSECGCASPVCPQAGYVSILALLRRPRMSALRPLSGAKRTSAGGRPRLRAHDKTRPGRTTPIVASRGCCPGVGRTLRVVAPFVARLRPLTPTRRHTPVHAATPRHQ